MGHSTYKTHAADGLAAVIAGNRKEVRSSHPIGRPDCRSTRFTDQQCTTDPERVTCSKCLAKIERARQTARKGQA